MTLFIPVHVSDVGGRSFADPYSLLSNNIVDVDKVVVRGNSQVFPIGGKLGIRDFLRAVMK